MSEVQKRSTELILPPGQFCFIQDGTKGTIKTYVGPGVVNQTGTDIPMVYNEKTGSFERVDFLELAMKKSLIAPEGFYAVLTNPADKNKHPDDGGQFTSSPELLIGHKIVIPGPAMFALWPGQAAKIIRGHHLRSNQYLLCRVYNEAAARENWTKAVVKTQTTPTGTSTEPETAEGLTKAVLQQAPVAIATSGAPEDLTVGKLLIIKGTEISFYIPPTGISVMPDEGGKYVREALTLKQLEYCILVDESGDSRIPKGPAVVFPEPTEAFTSGEKGETKFRATELNKIQGLHIKVTKNYHDPDLMDPITKKKGRDLKEGDEIFITGGPSEEGGISIYFPKEEHALIRYDGRSKHFAVAVPPGEGRYVMDRLGGTIKLNHGPMMLLPDPCHEVIVRRSLSDAECEAWYPGNAEALAYNKHLREVAAMAPTTRQGVVSEGDFERSLQARSKRGLDKGVEVKTLGGLNPAAAYFASNRLASMDQSQVSGDSAGPVADEISRSSTYTQPRMLDLNSKYLGAPRITPFIGYAVMIVNSKGERRVVEGPANILLEYDETLEVLSLSTGRPKNTNKLYKTAYLKTKSNKVSDYLTVETSDHVQVQLKLSYLVNFEGDSNQWWNVENYVKFLTDHIRSMLMGKAKEIDIETFYKKSTDIVRDLILGVANAEDGRKGLAFKDNGMVVRDVEVLETTIADQTVAQLLASSQKETVKGNIQIAEAKRKLDITIDQEDINRQEAEAKFETEKKKLELQKDQLDVEAALRIARLEASKTEQEKNEELQDVIESIRDLGHERQLARQKKQDDQALESLSEQQKLDLARILADTAAVKEKFGALAPEFTSALMTLGNQDTLIKVAEAMSAQTWVGGRNLVDVLDQALGGADSPIGGLIQQLKKRIAVKNGDASAASLTAPSQA